MKKIVGLFSEYFEKYDKYRGKLFVQSDMQLISAKQFYYIDAIKKLKTPTLGELAEYFMVSRPAITKIINKLEKLGYVSRFRLKSDKRSYKVKLTKEGKDISKLNFTASEFIVSEIEGRLNNEEVNTLKKLLSKGLN